MNDPDRGIYALIAGLLPPILGLGLIELYVTRDVSFATIAACLLALAFMMIVVVALADVARAMRPRRSRRHSARR
ncbi:MAG TPA: hypothetical protein VM051_13080 [Usitatibacter sp.]|nr:hypothetical protein [Usitatibacter sp.]